MRSRSKKVKYQKIIYIAAIGIPLLLFLIWRMVRPMDIFVVTDNFARPMTITKPPKGLDSLSAASCGKCHKAIYQEWRQSMHAQAWTDPYYQVDRRFDGSQQVCLNCHIPLQNQQPQLVTGFRDKERLHPLLRKNPAFDYDLQQEGITCVVCHLRNGAIISPEVSGDAPHVSRVDKSINEGMGVCVKCHVVSDNRWDSFYKIPPCGTVAEIKAGAPATGINCIECHMPLTSRPLVAGGEPRRSRMHLWRGGHDQEMVRQALHFDFKVDKRKNGGQARITLTNTGTDHFLPTGTPDRHLTVTFELRRQGKTAKKKVYKLIRTIMWRPFIIDLWDSRLRKNRPQQYSFNWQPSEGPSFLTVTVRYHLLAESRRTRINYRNKTPISYILYQRRIEL